MGCQWVQRTITERIGSWVNAEHGVTNTRSPISLILGVCYRIIAVTECTIKRVDLDVVLCDRIGVKLPPSLKTFLLTGDGDEVAEAVCVYFVWLEDGSTIDLVDVITNSTCVRRSTTIVALGEEAIRCVSDIELVVEQSLKRSCCEADRTCVTAVGTIKRDIRCCGEVVSGVEDLNASHCSRCLVDLRHLSNHTYAI